MGSCYPRLARATNKIMSHHYPERLGYALIISAPWLFNATWTAMKSFLDPDTVSKIRFVKVSTTGASDGVESCCRTVPGRHG